MRESIEGTNAFYGDWGLISSGTKDWPNILRVDVWSKAQYVQKQGVNAEFPLTTMIKCEESRHIWPVAVTTLTTANEGSSDAVKAAIGRYPWSGSGFDLGLGMSQRCAW